MIEEVQEHIQAELDRQVSLTVVNRNGIKEVFHCDLSIQNTEDSVTTREQIKSVLSKTYFQPFNLQQLIQDIGNALGGVGVGGQVEYFIYADTSYTIQFPGKGYLRCPQALFTEQRTP